MILRHNKYPKVSITMNNGGQLRFENYETRVLPQTMKLVGKEFFVGLISSGKVSLMGNKPLDEYFEDAVVVDVENATTSEVQIDSRSTEDAGASKKERKPSVAKKPGAKKSGAKKPAPKKGGKKK